jgi:hypothetical protein
MLSNLHNWRDKRDDRIFRGRLLLFSINTIAKQFNISVVLTDQDMPCRGYLNSDRGFESPISLFIVIWRHRNGIPWIASLIERR